MLRSRTVIGFAFVLLVTFLVIATALFWLVHKSFPQTSGRLNVASLHESVEIGRDKYGVVHLNALTTHDLYVAVGFVHAQDRLWQMELTRRVGEGRLAEILGPGALPVDRMFRTLDLSDVARRSEEILDDSTRDALQAYADGVNAFIQRSGSRLPVEFDMLRCVPEPWTVRHSLLVSRLMAWELDYSRWMDVLMGEFVSRFGEARARDLFPEWNPQGPMIIPTQGPPAHSISDLRAFLQADAAARAVLGWRSLGHGSNAWVVSGSRTTTHKPFLANDPHLLLFTPSRFHEMHQVAPDLEVSGVTIPGVPFVIIGRNRSIAWGLTNAMMDDHDFYVETTDSVRHPSRYLLDGVWHPLRVKEDTILVRGQDPVVLTVYATHRGPIINRIEAAAKFSGAPISMRWTGHEVSNDARAFLQLNRSRTWQEFTAALEDFTAPAQNFVFADTAGNIGYHTGGRLPIRTPRQALLPSDGSLSRNDWTGFIPSHGLPSALNPPEGYIVSANNKIVGDRYPYHITHLWEPAWRAQRIAEVLQRPGPVTIEDMQRLQLDLTSPFARMMVPMILRACADSLADTTLATPLTYLRNWNFTMRAQDPATTIFETTVRRMVHNTFEDDLGPELLAVYDTMATMPLTALERLMRTSNSPWFDDVRTPDIEDRDEIIRQSLQEAVAELTRDLGPHVKEWQWERVHTVTFEHIFGANELLAPVFNNGPYGIGGSYSTVSVGWYMLDHPYAMTVGSSTRQIFDLADVNNTRSILPPGQSGHVFHSHYNDQVSLWLNGAYRLLVMDAPLVERSVTDRMTLEPGR